MKPFVYIIDDDYSVIESLSWIMESIGLIVKGYTNGNIFFDEYDPSQHGCILLDVRMAYISGPELQLKLNTEGVKLPVIFISAYGDIPLAVRVMKEGAYDFITKPFNIQLLIESINQALSKDKVYRDKIKIKAQIEKKFSYLSFRELQIL